MPNIKDILKKLFPDKAAEVDQLPDDPQVPPLAASPAVPAVSMDELQLIKEENKVLSTQLSELKSLLETEKKAREEAVGNIQAKRITDTLESAVKSGKITQEGKTSWQKRLEKDFTEAEAILSEMPANPVITGDKPKEQSPAPAPGTTPNKILSAILTHNQTAKFSDN